jgi:hypothetical protein
VSTSSTWKKSLTSKTVPKPAELGNFDKKIKSCESAYENWRQRDYSNRQGGAHSVMREVQPPRQRQRDARPVHRMAWRRQLGVDLQKPVATTTGHFDWLGHDTTVSVLFVQTMLG